MLYRFHVRVAAAFPDQLATFDEALASLARLPQMFAEPDGSFVWTSPASADPRWQVVGILVDGGEWLYYVELKGACPPESLDELLSCLSAAGAAHSYELVEEGTVVNDRVFRQFVLKKGLS